MQDLNALKPTKEEIDKAVKWVLTQDVSEAFKSLLKDFLEDQVYGDIAERI